MKVNKMKPRINVMLKKALFPADYLNWGNILLNYCRQFGRIRQYSMEFRVILWSLSVYNSHKQNWTVLNGMKWQFHLIMSNLTI
jgi:hypothetical protein